MLPLSHTAGQPRAPGSWLGGFGRGEGEPKHFSIHLSPCLTIHTRHAAKWIQRHQRDDYLLSFQTIPLHACSNSALRLGIGDEILREADENFSGLPRSNFYRNRTKLFISMTLHNIVKCSLEIILFLALSDVVADVFGDNHISLWTALASATLSPLLTSTSGPILLVSVDLLLPSSLFPFLSPQIETRP